MAKTVPVLLLTVDTESSQHAPLQRRTTPSTLQSHSLKALKPMLTSMSGSEAPPKGTELPKSPRPSDEEEKSTRGAGRNFFGKFALLCKEKRLPNFKTRKISSETQAEEAEKHSSTSTLERSPVDNVSKPLKSAFEYGRRKSKDGTSRRKSKKVESSGTRFDTEIRVVRAESEPSSPASIQCYLKSEDNRSVCDGTANESERKIVDSPRLIVSSFEATLCNIKTSLRRIPIEEKDRLPLEKDNEVGETECSIVISLEYR